MRPAQGTVYWMLSKNFQPKKSNQKTKMLKKSSIHLQGAFLTVLPWKWLSASQIGKSQNYSSKKKTKNEKSLSIRTVPICSSPQNDQGKSSSNPTPLVIDLGNWDFINRLTKFSACGSRRLEINTPLSSVINIYWGLFCPMFRLIDSCPQSSRRSRGGTIVGIHCLSEICELNPICYYCPER